MLRVSLEHVSKITFVSDVLQGCYEDVMRKLPTCCACSACR